MFLPYDILRLILAGPEVDRTTLLNCSLVNKHFNHAASGVLYRKIVLSPEFFPVLDLRDSANNPVGQFEYAVLQPCSGLLSVSQQYSIIQSSSIPTYAGYVSELVVSGAFLPFALKFWSVLIEFYCAGHLSPRLPPRNPLGSLLSSAVRAYTNLCAITLAPQTFDPGVFSEVLNALKDPARPPLQKLTVNTSCTGESQAHILAQIQGLRELGLQDATRAVLQLLPEWLGKLSATLVALHLRVRERSCAYVGLS